MAKSGSGGETQRTVLVAGAALVGLSAVLVVWRRSRAAGGSPADQV